LAGETSADNVNGNSIGSKSLCGKFAHVSVAGDAGPMLCKHSAGEMFDFAKCDGFKSASAFEAKAKSPYAAEKIKNPQLHPAILIHSMIALFAVGFVAIWPAEKNMAGATYLPPPAMISEALYRSQKRFGSKFMTTRHLRAWLRLRPFPSATMEFPASLSSSLIL
jgi:hypothetical protein